MSTSPFDRLGWTSVAAACIAALGQAQSPTLFPGRIEEGGGDPESIAFADMNADGDLDLVSVNDDASTVWVQLGDGTGEFAAPASRSTAPRPSDLEVVDLDLDGDLDAIVAGVADTGYVAIHLGNGDGTLGPALTGVGVPRTVALAVGDMNGDGLPDLVWEQWSPFELSVALNQGGTVFGPPTKYSSGAGDLVLADLDSDGDLDVVTAEVGVGSMRVWLNDGSGTLGTPVDRSASGGPSSLAAIDATGDGILDVVVLGTWLQIFAGDGAGGFTSTTTTLSFGNVTDIDVADVTGDGFPDMVLGATDGAANSIVATDGQGGLYARKFTVGSAKSVTTGDVDGDGWIDVGFAHVHASGNPSRNLLFLAGPTGIVPSSIRTTLEFDNFACMDVHLLDANQDGDLDFVSVVPDTDVIQTGKGVGTGAFVWSYDYDLSSIDVEPTSLAIADLDADGSADIVSGNKFSMSVSTFMGTPAGAFGPPSSVPLAQLVHAVAAGDVDLDGDVDVVACCATTPAPATYHLKVLLGDGAGGLSLLTTVPLPSQAIALDLGDVDGDGFLDVLTNTCCSPIAGVHVLLGDGAGGFSPAATYTTSGEVRSVLAEDVDGDGDQDVVATLITGVGLLLGDGTGAFAPVQVLPPSVSSRHAAAADIDGDGILDLLAANSTTDAIAFYRGLGAGAFSEGVRYHVGDDPRWVAAGDLNGDGRLDVATACRGSASIYTLLQFGQPPVAMNFCFGVSPACPCSNQSTEEGREVGCKNSLGVGGKLRGNGVASLGADTFELVGSDMPNGSALYFQGTQCVVAGAGARFGDGLRCAGGSVIRLGTQFNSNGTSLYPAVGDPSISVRGGITVPGTFVYQVWYRNAVVYCTTATFNLTNGVEVVWVP